MISYQQFLITNKLGCTDTSFKVLYICCICVITVSYLPYYVIYIYFKLLVLSYHLESMGVAPGPPHLHLMQCAVCDTVDRARLCRINFILFYFSEFALTCDDLCRIGPICAKPGRFASIRAKSYCISRQPKLVEKSRIRPKLALNQAENLVKINFLKKMAEITFSGDSHFGLQILFLPLLVHILKNASYFGHCRYIRNGKKAHVANSRIKKNIKILYYILK